MAFTVILLKDTNVTMDFLSSVSPGSLKDECHNFIKVLLQQNEDTLFVCGTNAFNPSCRTYKVGMPAGAHTHTYKQPLWCSLPFCFTSMTRIHHAYCAHAVIKTPLHTWHENASWMSNCNRIPLPIFIGK